MYQKFKKYYFIFIIISCFYSTIWSQQQNYSNEFFSSHFINQRINQSDDVIHSNFKPLLLSKLLKFNINDTLSYYKNRDKIFSSEFKKSWFCRKLRTEDFIWLHQKSFTLKINPLLNLELKKDKEIDHKYFINTRGIEFKGDIGKKVSFYSAFYENQARFEPYITSYIKDNLVVPGQGAAKFLKDDKFDFSRAEAYLSISPNDYFNIQIGHSKHFIGEGYRSLILSDNSFNYPFAKLTAEHKKFQYVVLWCQYQSFTGAYYNYHERKYNAISSLSWVPKAGFELTLVESIMWPGNTPENQHNFNINFFNPLILARTTQYGLNSEKNILLGLNTRIKIYKFAQFYGQFVLDKIDKNIKAQNNYAFQLGIKHFDLFHGKLPNQLLFIQSEFNYIAPYTYTWTESKQSFSHYNQPLTHPGGAGLKEILGTLKYQFKDIILTFKGFYTISSIDTVNSNFGTNVFKPNSEIAGVSMNMGNKPGEGIKNELLNLKSELAFLVNPATNLQIFICINYRKNMNEILQTENLYYSFGIKTNINNYYYDF